MENTEISPRPILVLGKRQRIDWKDALENQIKPFFRSHDFKLPLSLYCSARYAIKGAKMTLFRHQLTKDHFILRVFDGDAPAKNPLGREYPRHYPSQKQIESGEIRARTPVVRWLALTDNLFKGQEVVLHNRKDVTILRKKLSQHKPSPPYPKYEMVKTEQVKRGKKRWTIILNFTNEQ